GLGSGGSSSFSLGSGCGFRFGGGCCFGLLIISCTDCFTIISLGGSSSFRFGSGGGFRLGGSGGFGLGSGCRLGFLVGTSCRFFLFRFSLLCTCFCAILLALFRWLLNFFFVLLC